MYCLKMCMFFLFAYDTVYKRLAKCTHDYDKPCHPGISPTGKKFKLHEKYVHWNGVTFSNKQDTHGMSQLNVKTRNNHESNIMSKYVSGKYSGPRARGVSKKSTKQKRRYVKGKYRNYYLM